MPSRKDLTDDTERVDTHAEKKRKREETKESKKEGKVKEVKEVESKGSNEDEQKRKAKRRKEKKRAKAEKKAREEEKRVEDEKKGKEGKKESKKEVENGSKKDKGHLVTQVDDADTEAWRDANNITILGDGCPPPYKTFAGASFPDYILKALKTLKFDKPTPIQAQGWPLALAGRDLVGLAETGSGKTIAFMLPAIVHIVNKSKAEREKGPTVLVLAPTRELAQQIEDVTAKSCGAADIKSVCVYGGVDKGGQASRLKGAEVIVATPGRLLDFMQEGTVKLSNVTYLVLDEADRMLDMGFELQINQIMREITSTKRQTMMFSATWPNDVQRLAQKFFTNPVRITIGSENLSGAKRVTQIVEICESKDRKRRLQSLLKQLFKDNCRILIFMLYKKTCENIAVELQKAGWPVISIHGDKAQGARNQALADFKSGAKPIMVATDVAARGLDIKQVKYVINVEFPLKCEDYVHRIGRTGRAGEDGTAYTFFSVDDKVHARELVQIMQESNQVIDEQLLAIADNAPGIKPKKTAMQQLYGDYASSDPNFMKLKPTRIVFDD